RRSSRRAASGGAPVDPVGVACCLGMTPASSRPTATCKLPAGELRGDASGPALAFRGIPYARPPIGALRFAPPAPAESRGGAREGTRFGAAPPQRPDPLTASLGMLAGCEIGEDCLTLNVFTPSLEPAARPELVWIPGGAFVGGTAGIPLYDGARLAARGDAVVVTVSYRVGALGFPPLHPQPAHPPAPNLGLQGQIAALRWVGAHVAAFGGDPARVTVFGESAGAGSILALAGMPAARGLLARAIVQSAAPRGVIPIAEARARTRAWLAELGLAGAPRRALRVGPLARLVDAPYAPMSRAPARHGIFYAPLMDGRTFVAGPGRPLRSGL